ncbi:hypothetical protein F3Y22_tig00111358pilonHSYRG00083 [Hibiscus syriacus]|uniref:Uncharacterized protein n=1 Tax=Hibiscus syriacus TaxID=106335 RepID=A0A6A2YNU1_HIBSY|nr:hypothetical protein F3Y22_tig00111358pilonHSYRG00083 [Hibiscus syriacus]
METTQKKKGLFKRKLPNPFSRLVTKASSASRKVSPSTISNTDQNMAKLNYSTIPTVSKQPTGFNKHEAVSYFKPPSFYDDHNGFANETWGRGDQNVDSMAATFISNVRQRFELDGVDY